MNGKGVAQIKETLWEILGEVVLWVIYRIDALMVFFRRFVKPRFRKLGIVTFEFFREDLNGFGGYGMVVKNVTDYCNRQGKHFKADVFITMAQRGHHFIERCHNAEVIFMYKNKGNLLRNLMGQSLYLWLLRQRNVELLMTIEYYTRYEPQLARFPRTPVLIWIQDPRISSDWRNITTVSLADVEQANKLWMSYVEKTTASIHRLMRTSKMRSRQILFAHQAQCLVPKACELYNLPEIRSYDLPNPITIPEITTPKAEKPTFCFLGRLDPIKRPWIFFELAKRMPHVDFLVAGRTHVPDAMKPIISRYRDIPNLKFLGHLEGKPKDEMLHRSWILINTSIHEALPVSFIEAFAAKTLVVSCRNPDDLTERFGAFIGDVLGDGMDEQSLGRWEQVLQEFLSDEEHRRILGSAARQYVIERHSFEVFEETLEKIAGSCNVTR